MIKILIPGDSVKTQKKGHRKTPHGEIFCYVSKGHEVCGDSAFAYADKDKTIIAVFDGVSGEVAAHLASSAAAKAVLKHLKALKKAGRDDLQEAFIKATMAVKSGFTTASVAVIHSDGSYVAAIAGDSPLYSLDSKGNVCMEITPQRIVGKGDALLKFLAFRNFVGNVLGQQRPFDMLVQKGQLERGDTLILASDGVTDNLELIVKEGYLTDVSGTADLARLLAGKKAMKAALEGMLKEIRARIKGKVDDRRRESAIIHKNNDIAVAAFRFRGGKVRQTTKVRQVSNKGKKR